MITIWRFSINGEEVQEPIGWDAVDITVQRSQNFHGLENIFSDNITFWGNGARIISEAYEEFGIDAELDFIVEYSCDGGTTYTTFITGILNCYFYEIINNEVTVKIEPSGFHRKVKNRLDTPINLFSNTSIGGVVMSNTQPFDLLLHSKGINRGLRYTLSDDEGPYTTGPSETIAPGLGTATINLTRYLQIGFDALVYSDLETYHNIPTAVTGALPSPLATVTGGSSINVNFRVTVDVGLSGSVVGAPLSPVGCDPDDFIPLQNVNFKAYLQVGSTLVLLDSISTGDGCFVNVKSGDWAIAHNQTYTLDPNVDSEIKLWIEINTDSEYQRNLLNSVDINFTYSGEVIQVGAFFELTLTTLETPSSTKAFLIYEMFNICSEAITDEVDSFRSNFFGRMDSFPTTYSSNGCGSWVAGSNGINIRKMLDKNGDNFRIVTSFNELYQAADAIWCLGMRIETDPDTGKQYIRVEPREFFYNPTSILSMLNVSDLKRYPAQDLIYNTYKVGYDKWNLNITGTNAIDEYNSLRSYNIPVVKTNKGLTSTCKYITSGYLIEQTRRIQYDDAPTNDWELDDSMFFICVNPTQVTTDIYTDPPVTTNYQPGTVSERSENFSSVTNVLNPDTVYNLRISPVRMALNWYKVLVSSIFKDQTQPIKFVSGQGNYQEGDTLDNFCIDVGSVVQNQDLLQSQLTGQDSRPIYLPEYLEFSYPLSYEEFITILNNSERAIQVSCGTSGAFIGFIKEIKYGPTTNGGVASFKLIRGECTEGDFFNGDYNEDFFIATC